MVTWAYFSMEISLVFPMCTVVKVRCTCLELSVAPLALDMVSF